MIAIWVSADGQWFEEPDTTVLAQDVTQADPDGRRAYRRLDGKWWSWLSHHLPGDHSSRPILRARLIAAHGEANVTLCEKHRLSRSYRPPEVLP